MKRDTNSPPSPVTSSVSSPVQTPTSSTSSDKLKTEIPTQETQHLFGENGAGQRKYYPNDTKAVSQPSTSDNKTPIINKSLGTASQSATKQTETEASDTDEIEKLIGSIDEPEEAINKTITDELMNSTRKVDYFQYYNSTTVVNKNDSVEYWSQKKDYIVSNILSKSHRRAIVSVHSCLSLVMSAQQFIFNQCSIDH